MLRRLVEWSLTNRVLVLLLSLVVAGVGVWSFLTLPIDGYPDICLLYPSSCV